MGQHHAEKQENQDAADVNQDLSRRQKIGTQVNVYDGYSKESEEQRKSRVDQAAGKHHNGRGTNGHYGNYQEKDIRSTHDGNLPVENFQPCAALRATNGFSL